MLKPKKPQYRTPGLGKNKEIKKERMKPVPLMKMTNKEIDEVMLMSHKFIMVDNYGKII